MGCHEVVHFLPKVVIWQVTTQSSKAPNYEYIENKFHIEFYMVIPNMAQNC